MPDPSAIEVFAGAVRRRQVRGSCVPRLPRGAPSRRAERPSWTGAEEKPLETIFRRGVVVNVLNPKTAQFFFAFLPQFVHPAAGRAWLQITVLGLVFIGLGLLTDGFWAALSGTFGGWLRNSRRFLRAERFASGTVLVGLGVAAALTGHRRVMR